MDRLSLSRRPKIAEKEKCLPAGDGLPSWTTLPLDAKFPMVPNPKGSMVFCSTNLCETKHKSSRHYDFDLSDPYCHVFSNDYHPLHDRHLRNHFSQPQMRRHLLKNDFLTDDNKVVCTLKEFNRYRQYLRRVCLMELAREQKIENENYLNSQKDTTDSTEETPTDIRVRQVQENLEKQRTMTRQRIEQLLQDKANRLQRRLGEMQEANTRRDLMRQQDESKRQAAIAEHHLEEKKRTRRLMQRWKLRERQHTTRMDEKKKQRVFDQKKKSFEMWETRKQIQRERIEREAEILRRENERRDRNISLRERLLAEQRNRIAAQLNSMKDTMRRQKAEREERCARRLEKKLALAELRAWARHQGKRRRARRTRFRSMWNLGDTMNRLILDRTSASSFLQMLNEAVDDLHESPEELFGKESKGAREEDDFLIREQARQIVDSVITKVTTELYPEYLRSMEQETQGGGKSQGKAVKFGCERIITTYPRPSVDADNLRPVEEHVLTPVPSTNLISPSLGGNEDSDHVIVAKILNRLLVDLNDKKLSKEELVKLTSYSLQILSSTDQSSPNDDLAELETGELYESAVADDLVHFTISKIADEVKSGQVSSEELTGLALSAWDMCYPSSTEDGVVDTLIDDTIQQIISDKSFDRISSVHDFMLDEFIVKTLNEVSNDLQSGNLPMGVISQILEQMSEVVDDIPVGDADDKPDMFRRLLVRVTEDVLSECSDTLYKVVNVIITSYHTYRESSTQALSELVADTCGRISIYLNTGEANDSDINFETLCGIAIKICPTALSSQQVCELATSIANILQIQTNGQNVDVDNIIQLSRGLIRRAGVGSLLRIARVILDSCQSIVDTVEAEEEKIEGENKQVFLEDVTNFVVDILKLVSRSIDRGNFTETDIQEMTELLQHVSRGNSLAPTPEPDKKVLLVNTLASILDDVEKGRLSAEEMQELGNHLRSCGERLLGSSPIGEKTSRVASFTSTAVAENVVSHVLSSIQNDIDRDVMNTESLKELAVCILRTRTSKDKLDIDSDECLVKAVRSSHTHPSPCESRLAEDVVFATIDSIVNDLNEGKLYPDRITSLASSVISSMAIGFVKAEDLDRLDHTMNKILDCLREDTIDREEAKRMFITILDQYKTNWSTMPQVQDVSVMSSSSQIAESIIRATLKKIKRDIRSGAYTDAELLSLMGSICDDEDPAAADDIVNLISATIQEIRQSIESETISLEALSNFLSLFKSQKQTKPEDLTMEIAKSKCQEATRDIARYGGRSVYIKDVLKCIATSKKDSNTGPVAVLQGLLQVIDSNILTNFIRVTLQRVLSDIGSTDRNGKPQQQMCVRSDAHLQSVTSLIAHNVVRNLMARIDHTLVVQGKLSSDDELLPVTLNSNDYDYIYSLYENEPDTCVSYSPNEIGGLILDTLNNIVSNFRLERSMSPSVEKVSSDILHDFVLEKLQGIVEGMQDQMTLGQQWQYNGSGELGTQDSKSKVASFLDMNDKQATCFVAEILQDVVHDMSSEVSAAPRQYSKDGIVDAQTSTLTLEVENIVVATLQDIVDDFTDTEREFSQKIKQEITKRKTLDTLVQIKRDVVEGQDTVLKEEVLRIIKSSVKPGPNEPETDFVENTINSIISNIEVDNIKASDLYQLEPLEEAGDKGNIVVPSTVGAYSPSSCEERSGGLDRPSVSLQKMIDVTNKMLKFHEEETQRNHGTLFLSADLSVIHRSHALLNIASALSHSIHTTIENVKEGKLSDNEIVTLATALSQTMLDGGAENVLSTASVDASIEDFIVVMLEEKKREIEENGLDSISIANATDRLLGIQVKDKDVAERSGSVSSVSSEKIADFVHNILLNIASSLSQMDVMNGNPVGGAFAEEIEKSESVETQHSGTGSISKQNINPNAVLPRINKGSSSSHIIPTKMERFTEVGQPTASVLEKEVKVANMPQEHRPQKDKRTVCKNQSKTERTKQNPKQTEPTSFSRKVTGYQSLDPTKKESGQVSTPINRRPSVQSVRTLQKTPQSKCGRHATQTKVSTVKSVQPLHNNTHKQTLPTLSPVLDKQSQQHSPVVVKGKKPRTDGKSNQNVTKGHVQDRLKPQRGVPTIQTQTRDPKHGTISRPAQKKNDVVSEDCRFKGQGDKKTSKTSTLETLAADIPAPLNLVPYSPPVDKRPIPMEVQSICGSHKTRIRVIKDNGNV
ncbi:uncharacterized protein LOC117336092 isoform X2 [Pecten maximus]|uniref:uncharacterized protein LOC117336092 isoform X2 n=1 Tax=Pecten maximus TaxID=6579 RepID=UPI001458547B|nr:uncharacterized protein LOC117336092 isoform X2 [Pecten maximus]